MNLTARLSRRLAGLGLASAAILLPTAALASSAAASSAADASHSAVAGCVAANTRVWYGLPADHSPVTPTTSSSSATSATRPARCTAIPASRS